MVIAITFDYFTPFCLGTLYRRHFKWFPTITSQTFVFIVREHRSERVHHTRKAGMDEKNKLLVYGTHDIHWPKLQWIGEYNFIMWNCNETPSSWWVTRWSRTSCHYQRRQCGQSNHTDKKVNRIKYSKIHQNRRRIRSQQIAVFDQRYSQETKKIWTQWRFLDKTR